MTIFKTVMVAALSVSLSACSAPTSKMTSNDVVMLKPELTKFDHQQIKCLSDNAYFEAGNQSRRGMIAVTQVVLNRAKDDRFPSTPCGVVKQKSRGLCQFSWTCVKQRILYPENYEKAKQVAKHVYINNVPDITNGAVYYHATYIKPTWFRKLKKTVIIGQHIFYKDHKWK
jgi:spore germination cell wall hydrolase CwlJ-like protein